MSLLHVGMCPYMTADVFEALQCNNVKTVMDFITSDVEEISQKCSLSYKVLLSIRRLLLAQHSAFPISGSDLYDEVVSTVAVLSTGSESIDKMLDGGVYTAELTEFVGVAAAGKTQLCLSLASSVALSSEQNVLYIDTSGGFDAGRLQQIMSCRCNHHESVTAALSRVRCAKTFDLYDIADLIESVKASIDSGTDAFYTALKLVVVDSVTAVVSPLLGGKQSQGQGMMVYLARSLKSLAADYSIAVVICNNMVRGERGEPKTALGRTWLTVPHTRIHLKVEGREMVTNLSNETCISRSAWLLKSQRQAVNACCSITIGAQGVYG